MFPYVPNNPVSTYHGIVAIKFKLFNTETLRNSIKFCNCGRSEWSSVIFFFFGRTAIIQQPNSSYIKKNKDIKPNTSP